MFYIIFIRRSISHNGQHRERRWRSGSSRWLYQQPSPSLGAGPSSPTRTVTATSAGTLLVVGATNPAATPVRSHTNVVTRCGPCSANNQTSSCQGYGTANGQLGHHRHSPTASASSHREAQLMLARKPLRVNAFDLFFIYLLIGFSVDERFDCHPAADSFSIVNIDSIYVFLLDSRKH